jgi:uncharacterized membrane protein
LNLRAPLLMTFLAVGMIYVVLKNGILLVARVCVGFVRMCP